MPFSEIKVPPRENCAAVLTDGGARPLLSCTGQINRLRSRRIWIADLHRRSPSPDRRRSKGHRDGAGSSGWNTRHAIIRLGKLPGIGARQGNTSNAESRATSVSNGHSLSAARSANHLCRKCQ